MSDATNQLYRVVYSTNSERGSSRTMLRAPIGNQGWLSIPESLKDYTLEDRVFVAAAEHQIRKDLTDHGIDPLSTQGEVVLYTATEETDDSVRQVPIKVRWRGTFSAVNAVQEGRSATEECSLGTAQPTDSSSVVTIDRHCEVLVDRDNLQVSSKQAFSESKEIDWTLNDPSPWASSKMMQFHSIFAEPGSDTLHKTADDKDTRQESSEAKLAKIAVPYLCSILNDSTELVLTLKDFDVEQGGRHYLADFEWKAGTSVPAQTGTVHICIDGPGSLEAFRVRVDGVASNKQPRWKITGSDTMERVII